MKTNKLYNSYVTSSNKFVFRDFIVGPRFGGSFCNNFLLSPYSIQQKALGLVQLRMTILLGESKLIYKASPTSLELSSFSVDTTRFLKCSRFSGHRKAEGLRPKCDLIARPTRHLPVIWRAHALADDIRRRQVLSSVGMHACIMLWYSPTVDVLWLTTAIHWHLTCLAHNHILDFVAAAAAWQ